jgi:hypothetical protein
VDRVSPAVAGSLPARASSEDTNANHPLPVRERVASAVGASRVRGMVAKQPLTRPLLAPLGATALSRKGRGH